MKKKLYLFVPLFIVFSLLIGSVSSTVNLAENVSNKILRLHIIANSDLDFDQELKLKVRDDILTLTENLYNRSNSLEDAIIKTRNNLESIVSTAKSTVISNGFSYDVCAIIDKEYFNTRIYDSFIMPAGKYNTLKIVIGEGKGKNWWCVMYPSVCISSCTDEFDKELTIDEKKLLTDEKFIPKFKIIELYESIKYKIIS